jgi:hypothetical protein
MGDILSDMNRCEIYQVLTQKKLKDVNREKLEEALAIYTTTDKVIKEMPK